MVLTNGKCDVCGKIMLIAESEDVKGEKKLRNPPYLCSKKKCKKQRGK